MLLERTDGVTNGGENPLSVPVSLNADLSDTVVPLELPDLSPAPLDLSAVTYTVQVHLTMKEDEPVESDLLKIQLTATDISLPARTEFSGCAGEEIDISPLNWSGVDANDARDYTQYYMTERELAPGETLIGKIPLTIPSDTDVYKITRDKEGAEKITFKQPGEYFMAINLYGQENAKSTGHFTIAEECKIWKNVKVIAEAGAVFVVVIITIVLVRGRSKRKR